MGRRVEKPPVKEKRTALNRPDTGKKTGLDLFWASMTPAEQKAWPAELKKIVKEQTAFWKAHGKK